MTETTTIRVGTPEGAVWRSERPTVRAQTDGTALVTVTLACVTLDHRGLATQRHRHIDVSIIVDSIDAGADLVHQLTGTL